jgi:hypothetical protein
VLNNNVGPDPLSTNSYQPLSVLGVVGLRVGGEYIDSKSRGTPFYELAALAVPKTCAASFRTASSVGAA